MRELATRMDALLAETGVVIPKPNPAFKPPARKTPTPPAQSIPAGSGQPAAPGP